MIFSILISFVMAKDLPGTVLFEPKTTQNQDQISKSSKAKTSSRVSVGNLPSEIVAHHERTDSLNSELIQPPKTSQEVFNGIKVGEEINSFVNHSIIAFPDEKAPVVAEIKNKHFKLIGESSLEPNSKRIFVNFNRLIVGDQVFQIKAQALSDEGQLGLNCAYHSQEAKYFVGDFLSSAVAGYFDGLIPRSTNPYGQVIEDNSVDSAFKKGIAGGAMSSAERFRKKLEKVPEWGEVEGPLTIKVLILDQPRS